MRQSNKYFLRGLGVGILLTVSVYIVGGTFKATDEKDNINQEVALEDEKKTKEIDNNKEIPTDHEELKPEKRDINQQEVSDVEANQETGKEIGDTLEKEILDDEKDKTQEEKEELETDTGGLTDEQIEDISEKEEIIDDKQLEIEEKEDITEEKDNNEKIDDSKQEEIEYVEFIIRYGEQSYDIAVRLYNLELIENYSQFDQNAIRKRKDKFIQPGTYYIPVGSTDAEILSILTQDN